MVVSVSSAQFFQWFMVVSVSSVQFFQWFMVVSVSSVQFFQWIMAVSVSSVQFFSMVYGGLSEFSEQLEMVPGRGGFITATILDQIDF